MAIDPESHDDDEFEADFAENAMASAPESPANAAALSVFFSYVFPGIFTLIGIGLLIGGAFVMNHALKSKDWPHVRGMITRSEIERGHSSTVSSSSYRSSTMYSADIEYTYVVGNQQYHGDNVGMGQYSSSDSKAAYRTLKRYPLGEPVEIYYDPRDPVSSVLEPGASVGSYILLFIGGVFLAVGLLLFSILPRAFKAKMDNHLAQLRQG